MNTDTNTPIRSIAALPHAALLSAAFLSIALLSAALVSGLFLGGCSNPLGGEISESGGGNVTLTFGKSDGRMITSGVDLPADVLASMRFEAKLSGPNGESLSLNATWGETAQLKLRQGRWRIDAKAYQADSPNLAGTGSISFEIQAKNNKIIVPMAMRDTAGAPLSCYEISVPGSANGQVEASFTAAYPGTTVTLTTAPAGGYILQSLTYTDGTGTYTPAGGGNEYTFTMPDADVTVSAVFTHPFYTITYSAGDGTGTVPAPAAFELGTSIPLPAGSAPTNGIPFHSWEINGAVYTAGAPYTVTGDVTLTARWAFSSVSGITAYLTGMSGGSAADPLPLPAVLNLADSANGWNALLAEILSSGKYVALDLSISAMGASEFDPFTTTTLASSPAKTQIVSLVLPDTPFSIAAGTSSDPTFNGFGSLKKVSGAGVTGVGQFAFYNCSQLATVSLPKATSTGQYAFSNCSQLATVSLPAAVNIGERAFSNCSQLATVSLPAAVNIGERAFYNCSQLATVNLSAAAAVSIGQYAFYNCSQLATVNLPAAATVSIGNNAFYYCTSLATVNLPTAATVSIGNNAFYNCSSLAEMSLPAAAAVSIGDSAFSGCTYLVTVNLPAAASIGSGAFSGCTSLATVNLLAAASIGNMAFAVTGGTTDLTITLGNTAPALGTDMFTGVTGTKNVTVKVPSGATGYGTVPATYSSSDSTANWGNGFRGLGWNGSSTTGGTLYSGVTLTVTN